MRAENVQLRIEATTADERAAQAGELRAILEQFVTAVSETPSQTDEA